MKGWNMKFVTMLCVVGFLSMGAFADDAVQSGTARVDIIGAAGKVAIKPGKLGDGVTAMQGPGASGDAAKASVAFQMPVTADAWKPMTFTFTPRADGKVQISLRGQFQKSAETWVYYDAIEVTGATIKNADFEDAGTKKLPADWTVRPGQFPVTVNDESIVKSGKACVKVSHGNRLAQDFEVKAGAEVTITLQARLDKVAEK
jgi:hypothetical protein